MSMQKQCWGRTGYSYLRRCKRRGEWRVFCEDHKGQWILVPLLLLTLGSYFADYLTVSSNLRGPTAEELLLSERVYTELSLIGHGWKWEYFRLYPEILAKPNEESKYKHVWDQLREEPKPRYTTENWKRFRPLFVESIDSVNRSLQYVLTRDADVLAPEIRTLIMGTHMQLGLQKSAYLRIPTMITAGHVSNNDKMFEERFLGVIRALEELDREVESIRDGLKEH